MGNLKRACTVLSLLLMMGWGSLGCAQSNVPNESPVLKQLSPGAAEVAQEIGVVSLLEKLMRLPAAERGGGGATLSAEALSLRQQITETVVGTSLEIDGVVAEIDSELGQIAAVRAVLEARRDRALAIGTVANIITSGAGGVLGTALQFKDSTAKAGNIIGVAGGGISTFLSFIGIRQQRGGKEPLGVTPNMLAKIFDRKAEFHSGYPQEVWDYLNAIPPTENVRETRRAQLLKAWTATGRIDTGNAPKVQEKIELLTSGVSQQKRLTIDLLNDRAAMLSDVRAKVSLMKRDLSKLMLALRAN